MAFTNIPDDEIDAGASALRDRLQGGKKLNAWDSIPNSTKRKWRDYAACVLVAAEHARNDRSGKD